MVFTQATVTSCRMLTSGKMDAATRRATEGRSTQPPLTFPLFSMLARPSAGENAGKCRMTGLDTYSEARKFTIYPSRRILRKVTRGQVVNVEIYINSPTNTKFSERPHLSRTSRFPYLSFSSLVFYLLAVRKIAVAKQ